MRPLHACFQPPKGREATTLEFCNRLFPPVLSVGCKTLLGVVLVDHVDFPVLQGNHSKNTSKTAIIGTGQTVTICNGFNLCDKA